MSARALSVRQMRDELDRENDQSDDVEKEVLRVDQAGLPVVTGDHIERVTAGRLASAAVACLTGIGFHDRPVIDLRSGDALGENSRGERAAK